MSFGAQPLTPEEEAQLQARFPNASVDATPPVLTPSPDAPVYGPPDPGSAAAFIDQTNAQPLPAGASNGQMPTEWPPSVPPEAPGMVPPPGSSEALGKAPGAQPGSPETPTPTDDLKAAQDDAAKARTASDTAQVDLQAAGQPGVERREEIATQQVTDQEKANATRQKIQDQYQAAEYAANQQIAQSQAAIKGFKFRDYFDDGEGGTNWMVKIGSALSAAVGAYGAGLTHGPNYALEILNKNMDAAHQHQVDQLGKMKDEEVMQRTGLQDVQAARAKAMADLGVNDAARDRLVGAQLEQSAAQQKNAEFAPSLTAAAARLKLDAAEKDAAAKKQLVDLNLKMQDEERKKRLDEASILEKNAAARLHNVQAAAGGYAPRKGAGTGGGSGGVGGDAVGQLKSAIEAGVDGRPLNAGEIQAKANALGIPAFAKTGRPSVEAITKSVAFVANQGTKAAGADKTLADKADKADATVVREGGKPIGRVPTGRGGAQAFATRDADYARGEEQLNALLKDVKENDARVMLPEAVKRRGTLYHNAVIGVATVSPLGKTDEAMKAEAGSLGASGAYTVLGANAEAIQRKIHELRAQRARYRDETLIPLKEGEAERLSKDRVPVSSASAQESAPSSAKSDAQAWIAANPNDPRVAAVKRKAGIP